MLNYQRVTSYYRVPMGTRVWPPFEHQLCCNLEGCPHVERDWRRDQYPGGRCGCLCCKVATIGGMACNHMQTVLVCVCVCMPVRAHAGFSMTGRLCWRTLSGFLSGKETSLFLAVSSHSVLNPASMCMLPQHLDPLAEIHWDTWSNKCIYIYVCNASEASWQTWEFPWRASMRVKAWLFTNFFQPVLSKVPPALCCREAMPFSPVQWSILRQRASSSHQKLWGCLVQCLKWSSMDGNGSLLSFLYSPSDSAHTHVLNDVPEMLRYWN